MWKKFYYLWNRTKFTRFPVWKKSKTNNTGCLKIIFQHLLTEHNKHNVVNSTEIFRVYI